MGEQKVTQEEALRNSLEEVIAICEKLGSICQNSIESLLELSKLALSNDAQCRLLLKEITRDKR